ncbi:hypothetical protein Y032_0119g831 [Ancylostoma ceylanicum]|uniref:Uncharacterized protein n=1 Tax=Ancylostoma ceylanicum TaxID=53326 RepID=A0A016TA88_9BILA|nr:hypothetical protein Y032_0119g831 [Ancylostoma ceylanicum]
MMRETEFCPGTEKRKKTKMHGGRNAYAVRRPTPAATSGFRIRVTAERDGLPRILPGGTPERMSEFITFSGLIVIKTASYVDTVDANGALLYICFKCL